MAAKTPTTSRRPDAERLATLFAGSEAAHGTHGEPVRDGLKWEIKSTAKTLRVGPTIEMWRQHLAGKRPLGVIPVREDGTCCWGSLDVDQYDVDLLRIVVAVEASKFPLVPCISKSGGLHLFIFAEEPVPVPTVVSALREMAAVLGLAGCEIFPKQAQVMTERGETGNWMVMPYYGSTYDGKLRVQVGLKRTGTEQTLGEFLNTAETARVSADQLAEMSRRAATPSAPSPGAKSGGKKKRNGTAGADGEWFADGPPCLQYMANSPHGFPEGGRNNSLFMVGLYLKRKHSVDWQDQLERYNRALMRPPLTADEVTACIRSLEKREYNYTCKTEPMVRHCHSAKCRLREFGVGEEGRFPVITSLTMLKSDPPIFFVDVSDRHLEVDASTLQNYVLFHKACMGAGVCFSPMKQSDWLSVLGRAFDSLVPEEAPPDAMTDSRFREVLEEFLTNMQRGTHKDDILSGRPWFDEERGRHYFRLMDLQRALDREKVRDVTRGGMTSKIKALGGGQHDFNIKGRHVSVHWVPSDAIQWMPELSTPRDREKKI